MKKYAVMGLMFAVCMAAAAPGQAGMMDSKGKDEKLVQKVRDCNAILKEFLEGSQGVIPPGMIQEAKAVIVFSDSVRAGLFITGNFAQGVALAKGQGGDWSAPAFFRMTGMGLGFQIGGDVSDVVLVIRDEEGLKNLLEHRFTMGADASAAAGTKGRQVKAEGNKDTHIVAFGKSKGLFAGVSVDGNVIKQDTGANEKYYGKNIDVRDILLNGKASVTDEAGDLISTLRKHG